MTEKELEVFFDYNCPFCYIESLSLRQLEKDGVKIRWRSWRKPPDANPPQKPENYRQEVDHYLEQISNRYEFDVKRPSEKYSSYLPHVGGKYALELGKFGSYQNLIFEAIWRYDRDVSDEQVLVEIADQAGLEGQEFERALHQDHYGQLVQLDYEESEKKKVWTIPYYSGKRGTIEIFHFNEIPSLEEIRNIV